VDAYGVQPHAHHLARSIRGVATLPDGTEQPIIRISDWDFHWQDAYRFRTPVALPAGTVITMEIQYDNSAGNPRNPSRPPKRVTYGQRTSDEMGDLWIQVVPRRAADRATLERSLHAKLLPQNISGYQMMVRADPENASLHDDLAMLYVEAGDLDHAIAELSESLRLRPTSPAAHYNLGNALVGQQRLADAQSQFREAVRLDPDYGLAREALVRVERALAESRREHAGKPSEAR
jgi:tetratricopeptide (TPR) repeat protein